jgi:anti-sigma B factor antagonist
MEYSTRDEGGAQIVSFTGDIDLQSSPEVRKVLLGAVDGGGAVLVDLSGVDYIDSSGVASMVESFQNARKNDQEYILVTVSEAAMRVLQLARLDKVFSICDTVEEALGKVG